MSDDFFDLFKKPKHHGNHEDYAHREHHGSHEHYRNDEHHGDEYHHDDGRYQGPEVYQSTENRYDDKYREKNENNGIWEYSRPNFSQQLISTLMANPKILLVGAIVAIALLIIFVVLAVSIIPIFVPILGAFGKLGLKGVLETLWFGAKG